MSADWELPAEWRDWAKSEGVSDPCRVADKFRDYWLSVAGAKGRKVDWQATWRNWVRNELERNPPQVERMPF